MEHFFPKIFLGLPLLIAIVWIFNYILGIYFTQPENLPASKKLKQEKKQFFTPESELVITKEPRSITSKESSALEKRGCLPERDDAINELKASLIASARKEQLFENLHYEFVANTEKQLRQLKATLNAEISSLNQTITTLKKTVCFPELERDLNHTPEEKPHLQEERLKQMEFVSKIVTQQLLELNKTATNTIREFKESNETSQVALTLALENGRELGEKLHDAKKEAESFKTISKEKGEELEFTAEEAIRQLVEFNKTSTKEILDLRASIESSQESLKLAKRLAREQEDKLEKAIKEADELRNEKTRFEEKIKKLESVAEEANRQILELKETSAIKVRELKASDEASKAALKILEEKVEILEDLVKSTQEAEALKTETCAAYLKQMSLMEEQAQEYKFFAEKTTSELQDLQEVSVRDKMKLQAANETCEKALKAAGEKGQMLEEMLAKASQQAETLKSEKSDALSEQKSFFENRMKQLERVAEEAKLKLSELKEITDRIITELKLSEEVD